MKQENHESLVAVHTLGLLIKEESNQTNFEEQNLKFKTTLQHKSKRNKGITLIALVVTIVVLLILAAITITFVLGDNGILKTAEDAGYKTGRAEFIEKAKMEVTSKQIENLGSLTQGELTEILEKYGTISSSGKESILDETITSIDEKYEVIVKEIWAGML